jgi:sec-independent protein translocase protein TatA
MSAMFAFLGMGGTEIMIVMGAVLLLFGPKKLPELARGLGKGIREFKKASSEVTDELERAGEESHAAASKFPPEGSPPEHSVPHALNEPGASPVSQDNPSAPHSSEYSQPPK